jgi:2-iminobutanoate/2-iminopropanoate deaminase
MKKEIILTPNAPKPVGPYSQAVRASGFLFISGQLGIDPSTGKLVEGGAESEVAQALKNLAAIVEASGCALSDIVKTTVLLADIKDGPAVNRLYAEAFTEGHPARAMFAAAALPLGARVEIEADAISKL